MLLVMSRDEQAKIEELDDEMLKLIDEIIILFHEKHIEIYIFLH